MKKLFGLFFFISLGFSLLWGAHVGKVYFKAQQTSGWNRGPSIQSVIPESFFAAEIKKGNLRIRLLQKDPVASMEHHRYSQYYQSLEVFGGEVIQHYRDGKLVGVNGEYYSITGLDIVPAFSKEKAVESFKADLDRPYSVERAEESKLLIYPIKDDDYRLAFKIVLEEGIGYSMTGIVDAKTGETLLKYSNIQTDKLTIGKGIGSHGDPYKFPTTFQNGVYWLADLKQVRPVNQYTYTWVYNPKNIAIDSDNYWDLDGAIVNAHAFLGLTYDYYYLVFGRNGIDDNNLAMIANVHYPDPEQQDNAFWNGISQMFFGNPGGQNWQTAAALDVVAHELSHGVTQFTSKLGYYCIQGAQPGVLSESISDIMGTAIEHYWQPSGDGFNKADWVIGEDIFPNYSSHNYLRSLSDPNSKKDVIYGIAYPHPCHLSQCYIFPNTKQGDWGGVHFNSTLYSHAYYLLSEGGTNRVSHKSVSGIGIDKATKIFYRAWAYYMKKETATVFDAANALLDSVEELYGSDSNERTQTLKAIIAIGL